MAYTMDNATSGDTFTDHLVNNGVLNNGTFTAEGFIRCFAHCLNLSVQRIFVSIESSLSKIRELVMSINRSSIKKQMFKEIVIKIRKENLTLITDVPHRCNATFLLLERALELRIPLSKYLEKEKKKDYISEADWIHYQRSSDLLKLFHSATVILLASNYPTIAKVLPFYNKLLAHLQSYSNDRNVQFKNGCKDAYDILQKYYDIKYHDIAVVLDPRFKLEYYKTNKFGKKFIDDLKTAIKDVLSTYALTRI